MVILGLGYGNRTGPGHSKKMPGQSCSGPLQSYTKRWGNKSSMKLNHRDCLISLPNNILEGSPIFHLKGTVKDESLSLISVLRLKVTRLSSCPGLVQNFESCLISHEKFSDSLVSVLSRLLQLCSVLSLFRPDLYV